MTTATDKQEPMTKFLDNLLIQGLSEKEIIDETIAESKRRNSRAYDIPDKVKTLMLGKLCYQACIKRGYSRTEASKKSDENYGRWRGWKKA